MSDTANFAWLSCVEDVLKDGHSANARGMDAMELIGRQHDITMRQPLVTVMDRKLSYRFAAAEALWILNGSNWVADLVPYAPSYAKFSDDGETLYGAYGVRFLQQHNYVMGCFECDQHTRQAVIDLWIPSPRKSRDIPCTLSLQFLYRDRRIYCIASMRSSDTWLGLPYDIFSFTMITAFIALMCRGRAIFPRDVELGSIIIQCGSQHLYSRNHVAAKGLVPYCWTYEAMSLYDLDGPDHLLACLGCVRDMSSITRLVPFFKSMQEMIAAGGSCATA